MQKSCAASHSGKALAVFRMLNRISGGSSETVLNELTVMPSRARSCANAVMTATPVGKSPKTLRSSRGSNSVPPSVIAVSPSAWLS